MLSKENNMKNFEIKKDYYNFDSFGKTREESERPNGVNIMDCYLLAGRSYRALGNDQGLFTNRTYEDVAKNATQAYVDNDGIIRWKSNGRTPFGDMLLDFFIQGHIDEVTMVVSAVAQEESNDDFWDNCEIVKFKCPETGESMVRFVPNEEAFVEDNEYNEQLHRSVA